LTILSIFLLSLSITAAAQRTRRPAPKPTPKPTPSRVSPIVAAAKQQVANQLYNVNKFVDILGPAALAIENTDREAKTKRLKKEVVDANEANKKKVVEAIRGMRAGLVTLESDFRTKPQLTRYLPQIQGISDLCARSEDSAIAGRFVASKDPLRQVAQKLSDTIAVLPK
jgi:hypothetical protein